MPALPTGTVTFLFTDIEGSTTLLQRLGDRWYAEVLAEHQRLLRDAFAKGNGHEIDTQGDAFLVAFSRAREALAAAVAAQETLIKHPWPDGASLRVRMGLHTGEPLSGGTGYVGIDVHRAARIAAAGHGGQILLSDVTHGLVARDLPEGVGLRDLGEHRLKDLAHPHHLFQALATDLPDNYPPLRSLNAHPHNLPIQLTSFIGRKREIAEVKRLLGTARLVTLAGSGGAGKTRLALQVAADVIEDYTDGVWLAEFAPIGDPALVPKTVASALGVPEQPGRGMTETLVDTLGPKALLLVLDNCEHLLAACGDLAAALLRACPEVRILATSREGLGVPGETLWRVPSLSLPDVHRLPASEDLILYDAVRLFVDRAVAAAPGFIVTGQNAPAVAQVCQQLDGIPLAIELAAARVKVLAVEQIAVRLDDRFRLLTGGSRMVLPRHQTLRAAIDWSYHLLSEPEKVLLRRLSVFAGGWTLEAAESVCAGGSVEAADILDLLTSLVDKSLVLAEIQGGEARYRLLETVRQYGRDRLVEAGEETEVRARHRAWCLALAERAYPDFMRGQRHEIWLERLETEHDNLRAALEWNDADKNGAEAGLHLAGALHWLWYRHDHWGEAHGWLERVLARSANAPPSALPRALLAATHFAWRRGNYGLATTLGEKGLALCHDLGDKEVNAQLLFHLGIVAGRQGDFERSMSLYDECVDLARELANTWLHGATLCQHALLAGTQGDYQRATALSTQGLALLREVGDGWTIAWSLYMQGQVGLGQSDYDRAKRSFTESLSLCGKVGNRYMSMECLGGLARAASAQGLHHRAARLFGAAESLNEGLKYHRSPWVQTSLDQHLGFTRSVLGDTFAAAWAEGRAMTLEQAIEYALAPEARPEEEHGSPSNVAPE